MTSLSTACAVIWFTAVGGVSCFFDTPPRAFRRPPRRDPSARRLNGAVPDIAAAHRGLEGTEAVLRPRALTADNDLDAYQAYCTAPEHQRFHTSPDQTEPTPTA
ncbi:hypothetical protein [Streptomyces sp. NPDC048277]|uniref:hypothetical protein n=1 Tax=Streptomyces sp. NPDC048277 TaxID=3155027 RepID=UPI003408C3D4